MRDGGRERLRIAAAGAPRARVSGAPGRGAAQSGRAGRPERVCDDACGGCYGGRAARRAVGARARKVAAMAAAAAHPSSKGRMRRTAARRHVRAAPWHPRACFAFRAAEMRAACFAQDARMLIRTARQPRICGAEKLGQNLLEARERESTAVWTAALASPGKSDWDWSARQ